MFKFQLILKFCLILIVFLTGAIHHSIAQTSYKAYKYSLKDGLSSELCRYIYKDKEGFVWISSDKGLNRYDGNSIYTFRYNPEDSYSLASNSCNVIFEDSQDRLWINTDEGISLYDRKKQTFTNYYPDPDILPLQGISYTDMSEDHLGRIWIGGYFDVLIFNPATGRFSKSGWYDFALKSKIIAEEKRNSITQNVVRKSKDELWILSVYGLFSVHTPSMTFQYHSSSTIKDYFAFNISNIDLDGTLWISTYDQCFYTYNPTQRVWKHHVCPPQKEDLPDWVLNIQHLDTRKMLITMPTELYEYDKKSQKYSNYPMEEHEKSHYFIRTLVKDNQIFALKNGEFPFVHYRQEQPAILKKKILQPKSFKNNHSYITTSGKNLVGDWEKGKILLCQIGNCTILKDEKGSELLGPLQLYYSAKNGQSYFSTSNGVFRLNDETSLVQSLYRNSTQNRNTEFRNFTEDEEGNIYIRERNNGIYLLNYKNDTLSYFDTGIESNSFSALYYDKASSKLWLATEKSGLYIINPVNKKWKNYPLSDLSGSKKGYISDIHGDGLGNTFLLMPERGLMHIRSLDMKAKLYTASDGLTNTAVRYGLYHDDIFWFTTESGLMAFDLNKERFYTFEDDKEVKKINYRIFTDRNGNIAQNMFPDELLIFDKTVLKRKKPDLRLYTKEILLFGKKQPVDSIIKYKYDENNLSLYFGYLGNVKLPQNDFQFQINDNSWQIMQYNGVHLYNMPYGKYNISVRYKYDPENTLKIKLVIFPPWWKTWWFYGITIILLSSLTAFTYRRRIKKIRQEESEKNQLQKRIAEIEMTALRAQMNPHFIFNCLNSINRFILVNNSEVASDYLTKFSKLIRMILDGSREDFIPLERELEALKLYIEMESMRFQDSFTWRIKVNENVNVHEIMIPPLSLQPYVENAIWHGLMQAPPENGKKLDIDVYVDENNTIIEIRDNGVGREKAKQLKSKTGDHHKSHGISLTEERLTLMQKLKGVRSDIIIEDLYDMKNEPCGTKIKIILYQN